MKKYTSSFYKKNSLNSASVFMANQLCTTCGITRLRAKCHIFKVPTSQSEAMLCHLPTVAANITKRRIGGRRQKPESDRVAQRCRQRTNSPLLVLFLDQRRREGSEECGERKSERGEGERDTISESMKTGRGQAERNRTGQAEGGGGAAMPHWAEGWMLAKHSKHCLAVSLRATGLGLGISVGDRRTQLKDRQNTWWRGRGLSWSRFNQGYDTPEPITQQSSG